MINIKWQTLLFACCIPVFSMAQETYQRDTFINPNALNNVVVYANKFPELSRHVAQTVHVITGTAKLNLQAQHRRCIDKQRCLIRSKKPAGWWKPRYTWV